MHHPRPAGAGGPGSDPEAAKARKKRLLIGGGAAAGVLALVLVLVVVLLVRAQQERKAEEAAPARTVERYLDALAKADASTALSTLRTKPRNDELLTDSVLKRSKELKPITGVRVSKTVSTSYPRRVEARYEIGGEPVTTVFRLVGSKKSWKLLDGTGTLGLGIDPSSSLKVKVNGAEPPEGSATVFPGAYELTTDSKYISFGEPGDDGSSAAVVSKPGSAAALTASATITDDGVSLFRKAVVSSANACLASRRIDAGCGLSVRPVKGSNTIQDGTVVRTISASERSSLSSVTPRLGSGSTATVASGFVFVTVDVKAQCGGGPCVLRGIGLLLDRPTMDLAATSPKVVWR